MKGIAAGETYVALGDSYSSGLGASDPEATGDCLRSTAGWVHQFQPSFNEAMSHRACAGATTGDVTNNQLATMDSWFAANPGRPQVITMTVGGNDIGFADIAKQCTIGACTGIEVSTASQIDALQATLQALYSNIRNRQPYADLLVGGYPAVVEPGGGSDNPMCLGIGDNEREMIGRQWSPAEWCTTDLSERVPPT